MVFLRYVIFSLWKRPHRVDAESVVKTLRSAGLAQADIRGRHLSYVYRKLRHLNGSPVDSLPGLTISNSQTDARGSVESLWGVIVEPREHPLLEYVVNNVHSTLGIPIQIFHGAASRDYILASTIGSLINKGDVVLSELNVNTLLPSKILNGFHMLDDFWSSMEARKKILFFQTDSIVCKDSEYDISDFLSYDYIGSKWRSRRPNYLVIHGGNGGLSIRDWSASVECIHRFPPHLWEGAEDEYFAFHLPVMGCKVGNELSCAKFATEEIFLTKSFGAHKIDRLPPDELEAFLAYCPEAKRLIEGA